MSEDSIMRVNPLDRWKWIDDRMQGITKAIKLAQQGSPVSPTATVSVNKLAEQNRLSLQGMLKKLREAGVIPFQIGKEWMVREIALLEFYEAIERQSQARLAERERRRA